MAYNLTIADNVKFCCGVGEVYGITRIDTNFDPKEVALAICAVYMFKMKKAVFIFEDVQSAPKDWQSIPDCCGFRVRQLAAYITKNELGVAVLCPPTMNLNSGNLITVMNWVVNVSGLNKFWATHEPKATEKDWILSGPYAYNGTGREQVEVVRAPRQPTPVTIDSFARLYGVN